MKCRTCQSNLDAHDEMTDPGPQPKAGDVSLCAHCGTLSVFVSSDELRAPTPEELDKIVGDPRIMAAIYALLHAPTIEVAIRMVREAAARSN